MITKLLNLLVSKAFFGIYVLLGSGYFLLSMFKLDGTPSSQFFLTLGLMTGSDPYTFRDSIERDQLVWGLAWIIHVASWLLIPALIGLIINNVLDRIKIQTEIKDFLGEAGVPKEDIDALTSQMEGLIADFKKGER